MDIWFDCDLYDIVGVALFWANKVSTKAISGLLQFVWYKSALALSFLSQGLNGRWYQFLGIEWAQGLMDTIVQYLLNIGKPIYVLKLKTKITLCFTQFHLEFCHKWMLVVCVLKWWKFHFEIYLWTHMYCD